MYIYNWLSASIQIQDYRIFTLLSMKPIQIIKAGTTFPETLKRYGDFDLWTTRVLNLPVSQIEVVDAQSMAPLPPAEECAGVIITGSHSMVTENLEWSLRLESWIRTLLDEGTPLFGICYGHQLLARAAGGIVGFHPKGKEIGTNSVHLSRHVQFDSLVNDSPSQFLAHTTHAQTILELPTQAVNLAFSSHDSNQAFRIGENAWGVQFHPEFDEAIMRDYISKQSGQLILEGTNTDTLLSNVSDTPETRKILRKFGQLAISKYTG